MPTDISTEFQPREEQPQLSLAKRIASSTVRFRAEGLGEEADN